MTMENTRPTRRPRRMRENRPLGMSLAGAPPLRNALKPLEILSEDQLMAIHEASLHLLENIGIEFMGAAARDTLRAAGARARS
jgi:trimethylamine--corrinoid protein Co-methyltransferase